MERILIQKAEESRKPISGSIELLPLCNMNCDMCYVRLSSQEMNRKGRMRTLEEWLSIAEQMHDEGVLFLLLTGGEPLLYPGFKELYLELRNMGMILSINTNGTLFDEEWGNFFAQYKPRRINITLYGSNEATYESLCHYPGGFEKAVNAIKLLKEHNVPVKIAGSATKANESDFPEIARLAKEFDIPFTIDTYMMPASRERDLPYDYQSRLTPEKAADLRIRMLREEMGESTFREYRDRIIWETDNILPDEGQPHMKCHAGKSSFTINWQGQMRPCVVLSTPSISVFEVGFRKAWEYLVEETDKIVLCSKCNSCNLRPICRTCAGCTLLETGRYDGLPEYMCRYAAESLKQLKKQTP